jgi:phosphoglycerate dehydrogenase-like enzyme
LTEHLAGTSTPDRKTVLVTGPSLVPDDAFELLKEAGFELRHRPEARLTADELTEALVGACGYLIGGDENPTAAHFDAAIDLEVVAFVGTDFKAFVSGWQRAIERGIALVNCPGTNARSVAEFTILLMLTMARPFTANVAGPGLRLQHPATGIELADRTLGIIGAGRIGARVGTIAGAGLGMRVLYTGPRRNEPLEHGANFQFVGRTELLARSDVVSLHRPATVGSELPEIGHAELSTMREGAILLNVGTAGLVDLDALLWAAQERDIRCGFDCLGEGSAWDALVALGPDRFLAVPQTGFATVEANRRTGIQAAASVRDVLLGGTPAGLNNPDYLEVRRRLVT